MHNNKYFSVFSISLQQELYYRASFLMDRARSITILIAFYGFWSAVFQGRSELLGYTKTQMFTYVLGMNVLRALVFSDQSWEMIREINIGKISSYLIRPISYIGFSISRDAANKVTQMLSALLEITLAIFIFRIPLYIPGSFTNVLCFLVASALAMILYFLMTYAVSALAFWTAESAGPRFCFELFLEFAAGAFFPLDVLPAALKKFFEILPFASLLHFPLNVYLERFSLALITRGIVIQVFWIIIFAFITRRIWQRGLQNYTAHGG